MKHPLQKSRIPDHRAFVIQELKAPFFDKNWHFHPEYQLFLVLKGEGTRFIGDHMKPFKAGDMVFAGPNLPHLWRNDNAYLDKRNGLETHGIVIYFPQNFLGNALEQKEEFHDLQLLLQHSLRGLEITGETNKTVKNMMLELVQLKGAESIVKLLQILITLAFSPECKPITEVGYINQNKESEKDRMGKVYEFVMHNFKQKIQLEEVAEIANMSVSSFSRYFKSRVNKSFSDFLCDVRISHACKLLHEEQMNVSQVSYESGFFTLSNFNKQFKEKTGKTPLDYKKEIQATF
jgi:AraC-like DNA-binding protein